MNVLITDYGFPSIEIEENIIGSKGYNVTASKSFDEVHLLKHATDIHALLVQWAPITRPVIASLEKCKVIVRYGIGVDNIDLKAASDYNIPVCNVPDYCIDEVADHTMALTMALYRQIPQTDAIVRQGNWQITPPSKIRACNDALFITFGFGRIAQAVLNRARSFGFKVAACDPYVSEQEMKKNEVTKVSVEDCFRLADVLTFHAPLTEETYHILNQESMRCMKPNAIVVNTSRGKLIDTVAAAAALQEGVFYGLGLDVFEEEPLPLDHPLRKAPNTLLSSHTAWYSESSIPLLQRLAAEEVIRGLEDLPLQNRLI